MKDWMTKAAAEISTDDVMHPPDEIRAIIDEIRAIIAKHCPIKPDVTYVKFRPHEWRQGRWTDAATGEESDAPNRVCKNCLVRSDCAPSENCSNGGFWVCGLESKMTRCINCDILLGDTAYGFGPSTPPGMPRKEVGPFCETCYELVRLECKGRRGAGRP